MCMALHIYIYTLWNPYNLATLTMMPSLVGFPHLRYNNYIPGGYLGQPCTDYLNYPARRHYFMGLLVKHVSPYQCPPPPLTCVYTAQVTMVCQRMLKEREDLIRVEYDKVLEAKLAGDHTTQY